MVVGRRTRGEGFVPLIRHTQDSLQTIKASRFLFDRYPPTSSNLNRNIMMSSLSSGYYTITNKATKQPVGRARAEDKSLRPKRIINHPQGFQGEQAKVGFILFHLDENESEVIFSL